MSDREARKIHGYLSSDAEDSSDDDKTPLRSASESSQSSDFDEEYYAARPPPISFEEFKDHIILIEANRNENEVPFSLKSSVNNNAWKQVSNAPITSDLGYLHQFPELPPIRKIDKVVVLTPSNIEFEFRPDTAQNITSCDIDHSKTQKGAKLEPILTCDINNSRDVNDAKKLTYRTNAKKTNEQSNKMTDLTQTELIQTSNCDIKLMKKNDDFLRHQQARNNNAVQTKTYLASARKFRRFKKLNRQDSNFVRFFLVIAIILFVLILYKVFGLIYNLLYDMFMY